MSDAAFSAVPALLNSIVLRMGDARGEVFGRPLHAVNAATVSNAQKKLRYCRVTA